MTGSMNEIYLDNAATTRCDEDVAALMHEIHIADYGNPSSAHKKGFSAEKRMREAYERVARTLKCRTKEIVFTSGGTESDNLAIFGAAHAQKRMGNRVLTTEIEHPAVKESVKRLAEEGFDVGLLPVDANGVVDMEVLAGALTNDTILVSVMAVNNEIGSVQPLKEIGALVKARSPHALFHTDAVQGYSKIPIDVKEAKIDLMSVSAHKLHGPKGTGFLYVKDGVRLVPQIAGGGQQAGLRGGTENVAGCAGLALAAEKACTDMGAVYGHLNALRNYFCEEVVKRVPDVQVNGFVQSVPHILSLSVRGVRAEVLLHALEYKGICVSGGSACSTHHKAVSETLLAIGLEKELLESTIRLSFSKYTTAEEIEETLEALSVTVPQLRRFQPR